MSSTEQSSSGSNALPTFCSDPDLRICRSASNNSVARNLQLCLLPCWLSHRVACCANSFMALRQCRETLISFKCISSPSTLPSGPSLQPPQLAPDTFCAATVAPTATLLPGHVCVARAWVVVVVVVVTRKLDSDAVAD